MSILNGKTCLRLSCRCLPKPSTIRQRQLDWRPLISSRRYASKESNKVNENSNGNLLAELRTRGLISSTTKYNLSKSLLILILSDYKLAEHLQQGKITAYVGLDPTAESLHLGNLMTLMPLIHLFVQGHNIIPLVYFHKIKD
jgi:tRNA synthetases class I (W and Y)